MVNLANNVLLRRAQWLEGEAVRTEREIERLEGSIAAHRNEAQKWRQEAAELREAAERV